MESARNGYRSQVAKGGSIGAHYLVGADGQTSLTVPTDKNRSHVRGNRDKVWRGANAWSIGIENVGMPAQFDGAKDFHAQVESLELSPELRKRLLAMSEPALKSALADGKDDDRKPLWAVHTDIPGHPSQGPRGG